MSSTHLTQPRAAKGTPAQPGSWLADPNNEAENVVVDEVPDASPFDVARAHMTAISVEAGWDEIMPAVFSVAFDREEVSAASVTDLTVDDLDSMYHRVVGRSIDDVADAMHAKAPNDPADVTARPDSPKLIAHLTAICAEAELSGVMPAIFNVILDRASSAPACSPR